MENMKFQKNCLKDGWKLNIRKKESILIDSDLIIVNTLSNRVSESGKNDIKKVQTISYILLNTSNALM